MNDTALIKVLADLFKDAGEAHQRARGEDEDSEWPLWYADYLQHRLGKRLKARFTKSELVYLLVKADRQREYRAPGAVLSSYYAKLFYERYL